MGCPGIITTHPLLSPVEPSPLNRPLFPLLSLRITVPPWTRTRIPTTLSTLRIRAHG